MTLHRVSDRTPHWSADGQDFIAYSDYFGRVRQEPGQAYRANIQVVKTMSVVATHAFGDQAAAAQWVEDWFLSTDTADKAPSSSEV